MELQKCERNNEPSKSVQLFKALKICVESKFSLMYGTQKGS